MSRFGSHVSVVDVDEKSPSLKARVAARIDKLERLAVAAVRAQEDTQRRQHIRTAQRIEAHQLNDHIAELREDLTEAQREQHDAVVSAGARESRQPNGEPERPRLTEEDRERQRALLRAREGADSDRERADFEQVEPGRQQRWTAERGRIEASQREQRKRATAEGFEAPKFPPLPTSAPSWFEQSDSVRYIEAVDPFEHERDESGNRVLRSDVDLLTGLAPQPAAAKPEEQFAEASA